MMRMLLLMLCLQTGYATAEDPAPQAPAEAADNTTEASPASAPAGERFEPSEQSSEDLSVSFPADI